jgi:hypothetical protein
MRENAENKIVIPTENEKRIGREIVSDIITAFARGWSKQEWEIYTTMMGNVLCNARLGYYEK